MPKPLKRAAKKTAAVTRETDPSVSTDERRKKTAAKTVATKTASAKTAQPKKAAARRIGAKKAVSKTGIAEKPATKKTVRRAVRSGSAVLRTATLDGATAGVLDRLFDVVTLRRDADPNISHSARLLSRGTTKVAQKFGEEAVECLIEAVAGNSAKLIGESADVLYHLIVMWVDAGVHPNEIWAELQRREGTSGIAEKLGRGTRPQGE